jgi:hypothetical protein
MIEDQTPIVNEKFGLGSMVTVIKNLQLQSDIHATKILDLFFEHFHIQKTVSFSKFSHIYLFRSKK